MPPKAPVTTPSMVVTTLKLGTSGDTSMADIDLQVVMVRQLQKIVDQLINNNKLLKERVNKIGLARIKLLFIKRFTGKRLKLKGFLTQMYFKIT